MAAWALELKAKGAGIDEILMLAKLVYKDEFDSKETVREFKGWKGKPWTCRKIKERLSGIIDCEGCTRKGEKGIRTPPGIHAVKLPPIPVEPVEGEPCELPELISTFKKWLAVQEDYNIIAPVCGFLGNFAPGEPDIIGIIGPSGSTKTEIIRSFGQRENQYAYPISSVTDHTFVSGHKDNIDTVPLLRGRIVLIKDLTTLLAKKEDVRSAVFADFRDITDGYLRREYGNGIKKEYQDIHSSILFASTNAIERYYSLYSNLGQRLLFIRPANDPTEARTRAEQNRKHLDEMRSELHVVMMRFIKTMLERVEKDGCGEIPDGLKAEIGELCDFLAIVRTSIHHDKTGEIDEIPEPEFPTRIYNTICKLTEMHALIHGRMIANEGDKAFAFRLVYDNIPTLRLKVLNSLSTDEQTTATIAKQAELPTSTCKRVLDELAALHLIVKTPREMKTEEDKDKRSDSFRLTDETAHVLEKLTGVIRIGDIENTSGNQKKDENEKIQDQSNNIIDTNSSFNRNLQSYKVKKEYTPCPNHTCQSPGPDASSTPRDQQNIALQVNDMIEEFYGRAPPKEIEGNMAWLTSEVKAKFDIPEESANRYIKEAFKARGWI
jgi:hypothetical protein